VRLSSSDGSDRTGQMNRGRRSISKVEGHWPKGALLRYMTKIKRFQYDVGNGLYRVFTTAKRAFSFQKKEGVYSRNTFFVLYFFHF
jgi:hypothetical protein